jgi:hypothetical protein
MGDKVGRVYVDSQDLSTLQSTSPPPPCSVPPLITHVQVESSRDSRREGPWTSLLRQKARGWTLERSRPRCLVEEERGGRGPRSRSRLALLDSLYSSTSLQTGIESLPKTQPPFRLPPHRSLFRRSSLVRSTCRASTRSAPSTPLLLALSHPAHALHSEQKRLDKIAASKLALAASGILGTSSCSPPLHPTHVRRAQLGSRL